MRKKRDIGQEILTAIQDIKDGKSKKTVVEKIRPEFDAGKLKSPVLAMLGHPL